MYIMNYQLSVVSYRPIITGKNLLELFKEHWTNGVKMYNLQHQANNNCYVFATNGELQPLPCHSHVPLAPNTVWLYDSKWWKDDTNFKREDSTDRFDFLAEYSTFMRLTAFWKWMHLYKHIDMDAERHLSMNSRLFLKLCVHANIRLEHFT